MLIPLLFFYMAFEAYHTASKRLRGEAVDEFSGLFPVGRRAGLPLGPIVLILLGVIFLLDTMEMFVCIRSVRYWPVFLILLGCYLLYLRLRGTRNQSPLLSRRCPVNASVWELARAVRGPIMLITFGVLMAMNHMDKLASNGHGRF